MQFFVVYIREAHPIDGEMPATGGGAPLVEDPLTLAERRHVASQCMETLDLSPIPALVDDVDDSVNENYHAWPDRLYLIGEDGKVADQGAMGPFGFDPDRLERAIRRELGESAKSPGGWPRPVPRIRARFSDRETPAQGRSRPRSPNHADPRSKGPNFVFFR